MITWYFIYFLHLTFVEWFKYEMISAYCTNDALLSGQSNASPECMQKSQEINRALENSMASGNTGTFCIIKDLRRIEIVKIPRNLK